MLTTESQYLREFIDIKPLPTPSYLGEKVTARTSTTYSCPSMKNDQWKENHERRSRQIAECGYKSVAYRPYQPVGDMCLDEKELTLAALGQTDDTIDYDKNIHTPSEQGLYNDISLRDKSKENTSGQKKLLRVQDLVGKDSDRISKMKLGYGLFQMINEEEYIKANNEAAEEIEAKARATEQWRPSKHDSDLSSDESDSEEFQTVIEECLIRYQPPSNDQQLEVRPVSSNPIELKATPYSSVYDVTKQVVSASSRTERGISFIDSPRASARPRRKYFKARKASPNEIRPFSPLYSNITSTPDESDREHIFRQLCVIEWLLEATAVDPGYIMIPITACWKLTEISDGKMSHKRQEKDNKKALENKWEALCNNPHQLSNIIKMPDKPKTARGQRILREGWLVKRSRNRGAINKEANYRSRYVRLTKDYFLYYISDKANNYKDCINLKNVTIVDSVKDNTFEKKRNVFQIGQKGDILYLLAQSDNHREDWINAIRNACMRLRNKMDKRYHPGAIMKGDRWSCCAQISSAEGCEDAFDYAIDTKIVKEGWLTKRSRNRKDPKKEANYRDRYVRMTTDTLSYYLNNKANAVPKDSIKLKDVTIVEAVTDGTFGERKFFFQVGCKGDLLYAHAMNPSERDEWVVAVRQCCQRLKNKMDKIHHPGVFLDKWTCCNATDPFGGCQLSFDYVKELEKVVKRGWIIKRSRGRGKSKNAANYRERFIILSEEFLSYYGNEFGDYKDCINMKHVSIVEPVNDGTFEKDFVFQVGSKGDILYICATNEEEREDWIVALRFVTQQLHNKMEERFHPGGYSKGKWSCCDHPSLDEDGCQRAFDYSKGVAYNPKVAEDYYPLPTDDDYLYYDAATSPFAVGSFTSFTDKLSRPGSPNRRFSEQKSIPTSPSSRRTSLGPRKSSAANVIMGINSFKFKWPITAVRGIQKFIQNSQHRRVRALGNIADLTKNDSIDDDNRIRAWIDEFGGVEEDILGRHKKLKKRPQSAPVGNISGLAAIEKYKDLTTKMRQKFTDIVKDNEQLLHDQLDKIERKRYQKCELRYFSIETNSYVHRDLNKMRVKIKKVENKQANKSVYRSWYMHLLDTLPTSITEDRGCGMMLERLSTYAKIDGLVPSTVQLIRVLSGLRHWEICSPDINAAIEFVRDKVVEMPDEEYEEWLRSMLPMKKDRVQSAPARISET